MRGGGQSRRRQPAPDTADGAGLGAMLASFLSYQRLRHYSDNTVKSQQQLLSAFIVWCEERGIRQPGEVTRPVLERYQRHLFHWRKANGRPLSFGSQKSRLLAVRAWFRWLARERHI